MLRFTHYWGLKTLPQHMASESSSLLQGLLFCCFLRVQHGNAGFNWWVLSLPLYLVLLEVRGFITLPKAIGDDTGLIDTVGLTDQAHEQIVREGRAGGPVLKAHLYPGLFSGQWQQLS